MSTQVSINPSVHEMEAARVHVQAYRAGRLGVVVIAGLSIRAVEADHVAALAAMLHRLGDELTAAPEVLP